MSLFGKTELSENLAVMAAGFFFMTAVVNLVAFGTRMHCREKDTRGDPGELLGRPETGKTVNEHIIETKIRDAKRLLQYSDMSYGEIAATLAFSSQAYFQTVFKRETGLTPGEYQNLHSKE